jgi:putative colanic acid biosynthesis glycosyltransferase
VTSGPWLTIVTVVKDDPSGLERTLRSLLGSDPGSFEHLVIDSSSDRTATVELVSLLGLPSRVVWVEPAGVYAAMNTGLAEATGDFVHFLNAGDELASPGVLADIRATLRASDAVWLEGPVEIVDSAGGTVITPPWDYGQESEWAFARGRFPAHQGTVARTSTLRAVGGFDTTFTVVADYAAFLHLTRQGAPVRFDGVIARFHEGGLSTTRWARSLREFHRARVSILQPTGALARREQWATVRHFAAMAAYRSPWPLIALLAVLGVVLMGATGVSWGSALALTAIVVVQGIGGALWWRMLRPERSVPVLEAVGMGLALGTASAMLTGLFVGWWLAPLLAALAWLVVRRRVTPIAPLARPDLLALAAGLLPGLAALLLAFRTYPLAWIGEFAGYHGDMPFFEALAASVARLGPVASMLMEGAELRYHSLAYAWAGQLTLAVDAEPFVVLTRLVPYVGLVAAIALAGAWTRQLTRAWWAPALAVLLVITGGFVGATYGSVLNMDSPSQSMGAVWLLALSILLMQVLMAVAVLVVALTGGKISTAAIAAGAFGVVLVVGLIRREEWWRRALIVGAVGGVALIGTYLWLLAGSANAGGLGLLTLLDRASSVQGLNPVITHRGILAGIALLMIAVLPRWAGFAWLVGDRSTRWQPTTLYGIGLALGGLSTIAVLSGGFNDLWFAVAASAPLAVLSATGAAAAVAWLGPAARRRALLAVGWGLAVSVLIAALWATGSTGIIGIGWRWAGPIAGVVLAAIGALVLIRGVSRPRLQALAALGIIVLVAAALPARFVYALAEPLARPQTGSVSTVLFSSQGTFVPTRDQDREINWTDSQAAAGAWLRANAGADDIIATNLTLGALVPSLTRLTTYVSNIHMQAPYGLVDDLPMIQQREAESWAFIDDPSPTTAAPLCAAGVAWVWVDPSRTGARDWRPFATVAWQADDVIILRLDRDQCSQ